MNWKILVAAGAILLSGTLYAQTPDGETPASEGVCDGLVDATPGLFGLCVAYCEAQDCDSLEADSNSCTKVLDKYNSKMDLELDPLMPCLQPDAVACPCFTQREADLMVYGALRFTWPAMDNGEAACRINIPDETYFGASLVSTLYISIPDHIFRWGILGASWPSERAVPRCHYKDDYLQINVEVEMPPGPEGAEPMRACWDILTAALLEFDLEERCTFE